MSERKLQVKLAERSYPIYIGSGLLPTLPQRIGEQCGRTRHAVTISDSSVSSIAAAVHDSLVTAGFRTTQIEVPSGEKSKSVSELERLWKAMLGDFTDRGSLVVAIGGGVVGDLAGYAAATFARGIPLVQVPTTLLSQVDSSVGGKTGINLPGAKNIVGAFWQPSLVVIDSQTLASLPRREFVSGLAEVAKYGVIMLPELFEYLEQNATNVLLQEEANMQHIVSESCRSKAIVVEEDERETTGRRAILNYGHTFAHAIENVAGYGTYLHGEAVAIGMHMAALLAEKLGRVSKEFVERQAQLLQRLELPIHYSAAEPEQLWAVMQHDKKVEHGNLRFVLPTRVGHVELVAEVPKGPVCEVIAAASRA